MKFKSIQASAFKSLFEVLKDILNDVNIYFDSTQIRITEFDVARVTLVHVILEAENFEEYECKTPVMVGINIANVYKLFKSVGNNDILSVSNDCEHLYITITNSTKKSISSFKLKLLDLNENDTIDSDIVGIGEHSTIIPSFDFQKLIRDMSSIGTEIKIERRDTRVSFECEGDFASQKTILDEQQGIECVCKGLYSLKYISMFVKSTILCPLVQIIQDTDEDSPIIFKYSIANLGTLRFYLATLTE